MKPHLHTWRFGLITCLFLPAVILLPLSAKAEVLTTTFTGTTGGGGNMFDVRVLNDPITVRSLDLNLSTATYDLALYVKSGTFVGFNSTPAAWTLIGTLSGVTGSGYGNPTTVDFPDFTLPAGSTNGFYVQATSGDLNVHYSIGTGLGNVAATNSDLVILQGYGTPPIPSWTLFSTTFTSPRIWNGSIHYDLVPIVVVNTNDSGSGSLREAIANARAGNTITFAPGVTGPISLSTVGDNTYGPSALRITNTLTIEGNGVIIGRDASVTNLRLFYISPSGNLTLRNVTLRDGLAKGGDGGGFYQRGGGGGGAAGLGGAIFNQGTLALEGSTLTGSRATGGNGGTSVGVGGIGSGGGGGGLASAGGPDPDPYGITTGGPGGGPNGGLGGTSGNNNGGAGGIGGGGGGAYRGGYTGGAAGFGGGGGGGGGYTIGLGGPGGFGGGGGGTASSASGAVVALGGFGAGSGALGSTNGNLGGSGGGGAGLGGAVFNEGGSVAITNSTISGNIAEGGNGGSWTYSTGGAGGGFGAGVFNHEGTVTILNSTLANNTVAAGTGTTPVAEGGAIYSLQQSGVAELHMLNVILANSIGGSDALNNGGSVTGDHNLVEASSGLPGGVVSVTNDPNIGALADNYGFTFTHALLSGSPAIDAGDDSTSPATDQRGAIRPQDGDNDSIRHCDIGAYEVRPPTILGATNQVVEATGPAGAVATFSVTATNIGQPSVPVTCTPPSGSLFPVGTNTVTCEAVDTLGVTNTATFAVIVRYSTLSDALDTTNLTWTTGGDANWFRQTTNTHDGVDAAASGTITHSQNTWMETTVTVPDCQAATLSFWWQVSSESGWDFLEFYIDGALQAGRISGTVSWQQQTHALPSGAHALKWQYRKDGSINSGADRGWVDQVQLVFGPAPLTFVGATNQVIEATGPGGAVATFSVTATNACEPGTAVTCTPASGSLFPLGTNTVLCEGVYPAEVTNTATFTVTVRDTTPPVLTCPTNMVVTADAGQCEALITFLAPIATDVVDPAPPVTCALSSGTVLPVGLTNVLCTATDASGNTSSCTFTVSVYPYEGLIPPTILGATNQVIEATGPGAGITTYDASSNQFRGTLVNGPARVGSTLPFGGYALACDGVNDYVSVPSGATLSNRSFSIEFWAKRANANGGDQWIMAQGQNGLNLGLHIGFRNNCMLFAFYANDLHATNDIITDLFWHHWSLSYEATNNVRRIYRDGVLVANDVAAGHYQGYGPLFLGRYHTGGSYFPGSLDEVRIWNMARTEAEIQASMNQTLTGDEPGLVAYYGFDEADGVFSVTATNICQPNVPVTCIPPSGNIPLGTNTVTCVAVDALGQTNTASFTAVVRDARPPVIVTQPASQEARPGTNVTLCVTSTGAAPLSYQWCKDGTNLVDGDRIVGATNGCLTIANVVESDSGEYSLALTNAFGGTNSADATLWVSALDHFTWSSIASPQAAGTPFPVTITARDELDNVDTFFSGTVALSGEVPSLTTNSILGSATHTDTFPPSGAYTLGYSFTPSVNLTVTHVRHYFGSKVSIWTDGGTLLAAQAVTSVPGTWVETPLTSPLQLTNGVRYRVGVYFAGATEYSRSDMAGVFPNGTIDESYYVSGDAMPVYYLSYRWTFVDLRYTEASVAVAITPTNSMNFVNGVWSSDIAVLELATNMVLVAEHSTGRRGTSNPFDVPLGPTPPVLAGCTVAGPGQVRLQATGTEGLTYTLQTSTNLVNWVDHTNIVAGPGGLVECLDDMETNAPACFYRLRWP